MRSRRLLTRQAVLVSGMLLTAGACSFLYDLDTVQCQVPDDCAGYDQPNAEKEVACIEGTCTYVYLTTSTSTSTTGTAGGGGDGGAPGCQTNDECIEEKFGPAICRDGDCIALASDECPIVLGTANEDDEFANLRSPKQPFIFGAYAAMGNPVPENTAATANYDFAINQVNKQTNGGYNVNGARRPFIAVVCDDVGDIPASMTHLVKTLDVPAVITTMFSRTLLDAFENEDYGLRNNNVFVMSTTLADSTLTDDAVDPDGLMWHQLGDGVDQAKAFKPLVEMIEAYLRAQGTIPEGEKMRIAMAVSDDPYLEDIAREITSTVQFNGQSVAANAADDCGNELPCFRRVDIGDTPAEAYNPLFLLQPHLVLAITTSEFMVDQLFGQLETSWNGYGGSQVPPVPAPFYVFSPYVPRSTLLDRAQQFEVPPASNAAFIPLRQRILGVTPAGAEDTSLYDEYLLEFIPAYPNMPDNVSLVGTENFYDAAWYTMYAIHGGVKTSNLTGLDVSRGMTRLLGGGDDYEVFNSNANVVIKELRSGEQDGYITLYGTMGPPDFRPSGARASLPSVYCIDLDPDGTDNQMEFHPDVLRYDPDDESLTSPSGEDPCSIDGFVGEP